MEPNGGVSNNTAVGFEAGYVVSTGEQNTLIGANAGSAINTGTANTIVGGSIITFALLYYGINTKRKSRFIGLN